MLRKFGCIGRSDSPTIRACGREISKVAFYNERRKRKKMNHRKSYMLNISDFEKELKRLCPGIRTKHRRKVREQLGFVLKMSRILNDAR